MPRIMGPDGPDTLDIAMGRRLKERRQKLGLSQQALAEAVGITFQQLQKYERGVNRISFSRLVQVARALRCKVSDLVQDLDTEPQEVSAQKMAQYLAQPGAIELLESYADLSPDLKHAVLRHARELADIAHREPVKG